MKNRISAVFTAVSLFAGAVFPAAVFAADDTAEVEFLCTPETAVVEVEGYEELPTELAEGTYTYSASADNYITKEDTFEITEEDYGSKVTVEVVLEEMAADYTDLDKAMASVPSDLSGYTVESAEEVKKALEAAKAIDRNLKISSQKLIDDAATALNDAVANLVETVTLNIMATAVSTDISQNNAAADRIHIVFSEPTNGVDIMSDLKLSGENTFGNSTGSWDNTKTIYTIVLSEASIKNGAEISYVSDGELKNTEGKIVNSIDGVMVAGNFEGLGSLTAPTQMSAAIVKGSARPTASKGDKIIVVFNAPVNEQITPAMLGISETNVTAEFDSTKTIYTITLTENSSVIKDDIIISYNNINCPITGTFRNAQAPKLLRAVAVDNDGTALTTGDSILLMFDSPTNGVNDISKIKFGTPNVSLGNSTAQWRESNTVLEIVLGSTAVVENGFIIDISDMGVMDEYSIISAETEAVGVEGSFGVSLEPRITKAVAYTMGGSDIIRVFFNTKVKEVNNNNNDIDYVITNLNGDIAFDQGEGAKGVLSQSQTYFTITLGDEHDGFSGGEYKIVFDNAAGTKLVDAETGKYELESNEAVITGSFVEPITPEVTGVVALSQDGSGVAKTGDTIYVVFNTEVTNDGTIRVSNGNFGEGSTVAYENEDAKNIIKITLGENCSIDPAVSKITVSGYRDLATESAVMEAGEYSISGNFGKKITPELLNVTAVSQDGSGVAKAGDIIYAVFNTAVNMGTVEAVSASFGTGSKMEMTAGGTVLQITLGANPAVAANTQVKFSGFTSVSTGETMGETTAAVGGNFGYLIEPEILSVTAVSQDGSGVAKAGDAIYVVFNTEVTNDGTIRVSNGNFGEGSTVAYENEDAKNIIKITLGENCSIDPAVSKITVSGYRDLATESAVMEAGEYSISGNFGKKITPELLNVTAVSQDGSGVAKAGDVIYAVFNTAVNMGTVEAVSASFGTDSKMEMTAGGTVLQITFGANPTVAANTQIKFSGFTSAATGETMSETTAAVGGNFGYLIEPEILSVTAVSQDGSGVAKEGDKIYVVFNTKMKMGSIEETALGANRTYSFTDESQTVLEITLGANPVITDSTTITFRDFTAYDTNAPLGGETGYVTYKIGGTFGRVMEPEILSVTAVSQDGSGIAKANDKIYVVYNTKMEMSETAKATVKDAEGNQLEIGTVALDSQGYFAVINLTQNLENVKVGAEITVTGISSASNGRLPANQTVAIGGSFGYTAIPVVNSCIFYSEEYVDGTGETANKVSAEFVEIIFSKAVVIGDKEAFVRNTAALLDTKSEDIELINGTTLRIKLGDNAQLTDSSKIDLTSLNITDAKNGQSVQNVSLIEVKGNVVPYVTSVQASNKTITVKFSSRTNKTADLTGMTAILGVGATANWPDSKTLVITLGENYTITNYIVLNGLGIKDAFSGEIPVTGQYKIEGSLTGSKLELTAAIASSATTEVQTASAGDTITFVFNNSVDTNGKVLNEVLDSEYIAQYISAGEGVELTDVLGNNFSGMWTAYDRLQVVLGTEPNVVPGESKLTVSGFRFAGGTGDMDETEVVVSGSFDGRSFVFSNALMVKEDTWKITADIERTKDLSVVPAIVCVLYSGNKITAIMRTSYDMKYAEKSQVVFELNSSANVTRAVLYGFTDMYADMNETTAVLATPIEFDVTDNG